VDATGKVTVNDDAAEGSYDLAVTAAGQTKRVKLVITKPEKYEALLLAKANELNEAGSDDTAAVIEIPRGSLGSGNVATEDSGGARRAVFIGVVGGAALLLALLAVIGVRRSRKAAAIEREVEERHLEKLREFDERKRDREAQHAAQLKAHLESVKRAQEAAAAAKVPHAGDMVCPSCRREYPPGSTFCPQDANRLIPLAGHETAPPGGICPTCKRGFNPGVKVCPHDGEELVPFAVANARVTAAAAHEAAASKGKICPTCGGRFEGSAGFCGKDGTALVLLN
jgi:hypothetical protein